MQNVLLKNSRLRFNVRCDATRTEKLREFRKNLLDMRKTYEDKRLANFKELVASIQAVADNEKEFLKSIVTKACPMMESQPEVAKDEQVEEAPRTEETKN